MRASPSLVSLHPKGEGRKVEKYAGPVPVETFGGRIHVEWDPQAAVTPLGQLPFFIEFLKTAELFDPWVEESPLRYESPNAPLKRDLLGTIFLSVLSGHNRYAHITAIRSDGVNPPLLGMTKVASEDSVRRGLKKGLKEDEAAVWLKKHLRRAYAPLLYEPWILDIDTTVKPLYGHQQGAVVGYNPQKPGRPSHSYHTYFMAETRLVLDVEIHPGNQTAAKYSQPGLWEFVDGLTPACRPKLIRGDCNFGNESMMAEAQKRHQAYLFKLRQSGNIQKLIVRMFEEKAWEPAGQGWEGVESEISLVGWSRSRRVIVLRRRLKENVALTKASRQLTFVALEAGSEIQKYEYAILVTSLPDELWTIAQLYRDRADAENVFDEFKNQWGWGGYTTWDLKRCRIMARIAALIYNWWSLFTRLAIPRKHAEAITSRPLLLTAMAKKTEHQRQTMVTITSLHAKAGAVQKVLTSISAFLARIRNAEQLSWTEKWRWILSRIFVWFLGGRLLRSPPLLPQPA